MIDLHQRIERQDAAVDVPVASWPIAVSSGGCAPPHENGLSQMRRTMNPRGVANVNLVPSTSRFLSDNIPYFGGD